MKSFFNCFKNFRVDEELKEKKESQKKQAEHYIKLFNNNKEDDILGYMVLSSKLSDEILNEDVDPSDLSEIKPFIVKLNNDVKTDTNFFLWKDMIANLEEKIPQKK